MNISTISFGKTNGDRLDVPVWVNRSYRCSTKMERTPKEDQLQKQTTLNKKETNHKNVKRKNKSKNSVPFKMYAAGVISTILLNTGISGFSQLNNKNTVTIPYDSSVSISEIADVYDVEEDAILAYNGITEDTDLEGLTELDIPSSFDYLQDEIDSLQAELYNSNLSDEKRAEITDRINACLEKQEYQQNIASVYTDGKYVYYEIKSIDENSPDEIYENFSNGINVEVFKDIFDIKDGELKKYNDLSSIYRSADTDFEFDNGYFDYSGNRFYEGDILKVSVKSINTDDISFDY